MTIKYLDTKRIRGSSTGLRTANPDLDFTEYADQSAFDTAWPTDNTGKLRGNPTTDKVDIDVDTTTEHAIYHDLLGSAISSSAWVCRFKLDTTAFTRSTSSGQEHAFSIGLCAGTATWSTTEDWIGLNYFGSNGELGYYGAWGNGASHYGTGTKVDSTVDPAVHTRWIEIARTGTGAATIKIFDNDSYSTGQLGITVNLVPSSVSNLRYFKITTQITGSVTGNIVATLDDFMFFNGVTSATQDEKATLLADPTLLQENTIFEETDTVKTYWLQSDEWARSFLPAAVCSGGTESTYTISSVGYKSHTFLTSGTLTCSSSGICEVLVVGGGGGCDTHAVGGSAGGVTMFTGGVAVAGSALELSAGAITITIGAGGDNSNGSPSSVGSFAEALGGETHQQTPDKDKGGDCPADALPTGIDGNIYQNRIGSDIVTINRGGGAGCNETVSESQHGGDGIQSINFESSGNGYWYGGGGGGGTSNGHYGTAVAGHGGKGGAGGGGAGHYAHGQGGGGYTLGDGDDNGRNDGEDGGENGQGFLHGGDGGANTGGGSAGGGSGSASGTSTGGSGIVVVRYKT